MRQPSPDRIARALRWRPFTDLSTIAISLLIAVLAIPVLGFHPGLIGLFAGIGLAAILRFWWIAHRVDPIVIAPRFILCMAFVGLLGFGASLAEIALLRPSDDSVAVATASVGVLFVFAGVPGYRFFRRIQVSSK